ncbi:glycosyltransferase family 2 protein [Enterococcus faecium]|nr:glycosyltransferase family 2 protein [Enterococcus faecium]
MQSYSNIELVIVNDNSSDGTKEYLDKIIGENIVIKHLYSSQSQGGNHARNVGIKNCSGELVAFLDDDDFGMTKN